MTLFTNHKHESIGMQHKRENPLSDCSVAKSFFKLDGNKGLIGTLDEIRLFNHPQGHFNIYNNVWENTAHSSISRMHFALISGNVF